LGNISAQGIKADVILNDIANAELDAASINAKDAASIIPLSASCACCESLEELSHLCKTVSEGDGDLLFIELNGTADPLALIENFLILKDQLPFDPIIPICLIDVRHWGKRGKLTSLEKRQMEASVFHCLSYTDRAESEDTHQTRNIISECFPKSREVTKDEFSEQLVSLFKNSDDNSILGDFHEFSQGGESHHDEVHLLSHQIQGCQVSLPPKVRRSAIERILKKLPNEVLRAKALVKIIEAPGAKWLFERANNEINSSLITVSYTTHLSSSLLCVGLELNTSDIKEIVSDEFGYPAELK
tara:strand:- start:570 stop:1472 length:903 start_codon:yes stop_codon:yes gene_type:complete